MSASHRTSFTLSGPSIEFDPRLDAVRGDLADIALAGRLFAPHYAEPVRKTCILPYAPVYHVPDGEQATELLEGESFCLLDTSAGWSWGFTAHDHYVGYVKAEALGEFVDPPVLDKTDALKTAHAFLGMPYVWGGRGGEGIDCSGLVQRSFASAGISLPRDSDLQLAEVGKDIPAGEVLQRGDIIFFLGHVGIMEDASNLLHATRHHGKVVSEPLADVEARFKDRNDGIGIIARRRITA